MGNPSPAIVGPVAPPSVCDVFIIRGNNLNNFTKVNSKVLAEDVVQLSTKATSAKNGANIAMKKLIEMANKLIK